VTLVVYPNALVRQVTLDLATIAGASGLTFDLREKSVTSADGTQTVMIHGSGRIGFSTSPDTSAPPEPLSRQFVRWFTLPAQDHLYVAIFAALPTTVIAGTTLGDVGGMTARPVIKGGLTLIAIYYDGTNCNAKGYSVLGADAGTNIDLPSDVLLFHELVHAWRLASGTESVDPELQVVTAGTGDATENGYRAERNLPLRNAQPGMSHLGKGLCRVEDKKPQTTSCFVATAAYGSELAPQVEQLREFRDRVLRPTRAGSDFFERFYARYDELSQPIAERMRRDPETAELIRIALVEPIVHYLELAVRLPDAPLDDVPEPWRTHLEHELAVVDRWASQVAPPRCLRCVSPQRAAEELAVFLRHLIRSPERRAAYLDDLERGGQLPLTGTQAQLDAARAILEQAGRSPAEISRIIGSPMPFVTGPSAADGIRTGFGDDRQDVAVADEQNWFYTVTIRNATDETPSPQSLDFRMFYDVKGETGVHYWEVMNVWPMQTAVFPMGLCSELESYAWGAWGFTDPNNDNNLVYDVVATWPPDPSTDPPVKPGDRPDPEMCADSYVIGP
jgi:hypothetical protein